MESKARVRKLEKRRFRVAKLRVRLDFIGPQRWVVTAIRVLKVEIAFSRYGIVHQSIAVLFAVEDVL